MRGKKSQCADAGDNAGLSYQRIQVKLSQKERMLLSGLLMCYSQEEIFHDVVVSRINRLAESDRFRKFVAVLTEQIEQK